MIVSTHAPLAGRDGHFLSVDRVGVRISTHAPLAGRDAVEAVGYSDDFEFQPTRPLRGATLVRLPVFKKV